METPISSTELQTKPLQAEPVMVLHTVLLEPSRQSILQAVVFFQEAAVSVSLRARSLFWSCPAFAFPFPHYTIGWQGLDVWSFSLPSVGVQILSADTNH